MKLVKAGAAISTVWGKTIPPGQAPIKCKQEHLGTVYVTYGTSTREDYGIAASRGGVFRPVGHLEIGRNLFLLLACMSSTDIS